MHKKLASAFTLCVLGFAGIGTAHATVFGGSASFTDLTNPTFFNPLQVSANPTNFSTPSLTAGQNYLFSSFMTVDTSHLGTDHVALNISWTDPSSANTTQGGSVTESSFLFFFTSGSLTWNGSSNGYASQNVTFSDGALAEIDVYNASWSGDSGSFAVKIRDLKDPTTTTTVPEPFSMALLGTGLLGIGFVKRRRGV